MRKIKKKEFEVERIAMWDKSQAIKTMKWPEHWNKLNLTGTRQLIKLMMRQEKEGIDLNVEVVENEINLKCARGRHYYILYYFIFFLIMVNTLNIKSGSGSWLWEKNDIWSQSEEVSRCLKGK